MGPIVLLTGVLILLYALASAFAGGSVASAARGVPHTRRYAWVSGGLGAALIVAGLILIVG
jgi:hypothetical protein